MNVNIHVYKFVNEFQLINVVDQPSLSNFIVPSYIRQGKLIISVSTSGVSPLLSKKIKDELGSVYNQNYGEYLLFLQACREKVKEQIVDAKMKRQILLALLEDTYFTLTNEKRYEERDERFQKLLEKGRE